MDYHFVTNDTDDKSSSQLGKIIRKYAPVFMLTILLPMLVGLMVNPPQLGFTSRADANPSLRIWIEPELIQSAPGGRVTMKVMASFDSDTKLMPFVNLKAESRSLSVSSGELSYNTPFKGGVVIGDINIIAPRQRGTYTIDLPQESVDISAYSGDVKIMTSPGTVIVN